MFNETHLPTSEVGSDDEEYLPTAELDDPVLSEEPVSDSRVHLCTHQIPRPATQPLQPNQVEMPQEPEHMYIDIPEDTQDLIDVPGELLSDFDSWKQSELVNSSL